MDAIESGIVKIPRTPVDDDATGNLVTYLRLWDYVGKYAAEEAGKRDDRRGRVGYRRRSSKAHCRSLYRSYYPCLRALAERSLRRYGEPPPVFIVVCPNTVVSKLVYDWIAGGGADRRHGST